MEFINQQIPVENLPRYGSVKYTPLAERFAFIRLGVILTFYFFLLLALFTAALLINRSSTETQPIFSSLSVVVLILGIAIVLILIAWFVFAATRAIHYSIREHDIIVKSGLFWKKEIIQPLKRVQHVEVTQGPLDKRFTLANVKLFSAGTRQSTFRIPGIKKHLAEQIRQYVLDYQESSANVKQDSPDQ